MISGEIVADLREEAEMRGNARWEALEQDSDLS